jgi:hypothetical protein
MPDLGILVPVQTVDARCDPLAIMVLCWFDPLKVEARKRNRVVS